MMLGGDRVRCPRKLRTQQKDTQGGTKKMTSLRKQSRPTPHLEPSFTEQKKTFQTQLFGQIPTKGAPSEMCIETTTQQGSSKCGRTRWRGPMGLLSLSPPAPFTAAMIRLHTISPRPSQAASLRPSLNSIRFRKHPAELGTVRAPETPDAVRKGKQAGRLQTPESGRMTCRVLIHGVTPSRSPSPAFLTPGPHSGPTPSSPRCHTSRGRR